MFNYTLLTLKETLGNCKWSIVLIDEWVPEQHDLIASLGSGPEQKGRVLTKHPAERVNGLIKATQPAEECECPTADRPTAEDSDDPVPRF